jgi:hypothetical protein
MRGIPMCMGSDFQERGFQIQKGAATAVIFIVEK